MPTHFSGPILGSANAVKGLYEDLPLAEVDKVRSRYTVHVEKFNEPFVTGQLILNGAHVDDLNTATAPTQVVTAETAYLLINPGTKADAGSSIVFDIAPTAAALGNSFNTLRSLTSTATLMDNRELVWACRFGVTSDLAATWDGKAIFGWLTADTAPIDTGTGNPSLATGAGAGFHISETGAIRYFGQQASLGSLTGTVTTGLNVNNGLATAGVFDWYEVGFRIKWLDASAGTGSIDYYINNSFVGRITSGLPMASTEVYASTFAVANGPTQLADFALDYLITAVTGPGR